jgi:DNA-binding MarR family transcriptional regulator
MPDVLTRAGLGTLAAAVRRRLKQVVAAKLLPYDLTLQQFWVLLVLLEKGSCSLHPLAQLVWMDDPTASRVVKTMVERDLLETKPDPSHGRRILISLTPRSVLLAQELQGIATEVKSGMVAGLQPDEQAVLRQGLLAVFANLGGMLAANPDAAPDHESIAAS